MDEAAHLRRPDHLIEPLFLKRWSPRAFDASDMPLADLMRMLEAARWAASAYNVQPWRFVYALRSDPVWQRWQSLLDPFNAAWASGHRRWCSCFPIASCRRGRGVTPA